MLQHERTVFNTQVHCTSCSGIEAGPDKRADRILTRLMPERNPASFTSNLFHSFSLSR